MLPPRLDMTRSGPRSPLWARDCPPPAKPSERTAWHLRHLVLRSAKSQWSGRWNPPHGKDTGLGPSPSYRFRPRDSSCWWFSDAGGNACQTQGHRPGPNAKCSWHQSITLGQNLGHVEVRQRIAKIPAHRPQDHLPRILASLKWILRDHRHQFYPTRANDDLRNGTVLCALMASTATLAFRLGG